MNPSITDRWQEIRLGAAHHRLRRPLAGVLVLAAIALAAGDVLRSDSSGSLRVVVATRDLVPGEVVTDTDLTTIRLPAESAPDGALDSPTDATDLSVAGPVRRGEIITDIRLLTPRLTAAALGDVDARIVPIRPADPAIVELLGAGDRVDILAADDDTGGAEPIAGDALVVLVPEVIDIDERPILVALPGPEASALAAASLTRALTITMR